MEKNGANDGPCPCSRDIWKYLPPELRPKPAPRNEPEGFRKVICPGCHKLFLTNRETDYCFDCEQSQQEGQG